VRSSWPVWGRSGRTSVAGWSSLVARRAHNPEVVGSNPTPATSYSKDSGRRPLSPCFFTRIPRASVYDGFVRKRLVLLAALGDLAVIGILAFSWYEVIAFYHLSRLHREPDYLGKIVKLPEGTAAREAVSRYLEGKRGKPALIRECLRRERALLQGDLALQLEAPRTTHVAITLNPDNTVKLNGAGDRRWWACNSYDRVDTELIVFIDALLTTREHYRLPEYPGIDFEYRSR
jgi:hypothetical protein